MKHTEQDIEKVVDRLATSTRSPRGRFSMEATRPLLEKRIAARRRRPWLRIGSAAAAVAVLCVLTWTAYIYMTPPSLLMESTLAGTKAIRLPDGTEVMLNRYSTITYPSRFNGEERRVSLYGEAYFDVTKDKDHPFIVNTGSVGVRVLGTEFNVEAYPKDEVVKTTLYQGSVAVDTEDHHSLVLVPGESAVYDKATKQLNKSADVPLSDEIAWKDGALVFSRVPLREIARQLSNAFDVTIRVDGDQLGDRILNSRFIHGESLDSILNLLCEAGQFDVKRENENLYILTKQ